eukprot:2588838-Prymnesium_polylepis.2
MVGAPAPGSTRTLYLAPSAEAERVPLPGRCPFAPLCLALSCQSVSRACPVSRRCCLVMLWPYVETRPLARSHGPPSSRIGRRSTLRSPRAPTAQNRRPHTARACRRKSRTLLPAPAAHPTCPTRRRTLSCRSRLSRCTPARSARAVMCTGVRLAVRERQQTPSPTVPPAHAERYRHVNACLVAHARRRRTLQSRMSCVRSMVEGAQLKRTTVGA